jgi:hypothetical protein
MRSRIYDANIPALKLPKLLGITDLVLGNREVWVVEREGLGVEASCGAVRKSPNLNMTRS